MKNKRFVFLSLGECKVSLQQTAKVVILLYLVHNLGRICRLSFCLSVSVGFMLLM